MKNETTACRGIRQILRRVGKSNLRKIFWILLLASSGFSIVYYNYNQGLNYNTGSSVVQNCLKPRAITSANDLPKLHDSAERRELNEVDQNLRRMTSDDPKIVNYIRDNCEVLLRPPDGKPTNHKGMDASMGQDKIVHRILKNMSGGVFIEFGGLDGVTGSNTLTFERDFGWTGLIIEPDPNNLVVLHKHHRNAWISHSCVSVKNYPHEVTFQPHWDLGKIKDVIKDSAQASDLGKDLIRVQCFPLYSFLVALNWRVIDYMSVDVEGYELDVLKTFPFDKVLVKVVTVEIVNSVGGRGPTQEFMESNGFKTVGLFYFAGRTIPFDSIFVHNSIELDPSAIQLIESRYYNKAYPHN